MFMNIISMSQTCLYSIFYQKVTRFLQLPVATGTFGYSLA